MPNEPRAPTGEGETLEERLRQQVVSDLPYDWQEGRKCPECGFNADRQKCAFEMGGACPRNDPEMYDEDPYTYSPDPLCIEAAEELARLRAEVARLTAELAEADRRAGAAERQLSQLLGGVNTRRRWLEEAKVAAGHDQNVSFDVVWADAMEKARRTDAAEARAARAEEEARRYRETLVKIDDDAAHWLANEPIGQPNPYARAIDDACRRALTGGGVDA